MSGDLLTIEATDREVTGKSACRKLRKEGLIPANLIGKGESKNLQLNPKLLSKAFKSGKKFNLSYNGETKAVVMHEIHVDRVKRLPLHVDLMYV